MLSTYSQRTKKQTKKDARERLALEDADGHHDQKGGHGHEEDERRRLPHDVQAPVVDARQGDGDAGHDAEVYPRNVRFGDVREVVGVDVGEEEDGGGGAVRDPGHPP